MLSDYILTVAGARSRRKAYASHFKTTGDGSMGASITWAAPTYELNPLWQETIAKLRWFNGRHFMLTVVVSAIVIGGYIFGSKAGGFIYDWAEDTFFTPLPDTERPEE
jgi:hypothetical protein